MLSLERPIKKNYILGTTIVTSYVRLKHLSRHKGRITAPGR